MLTTTIIDTNTPLSGLFLLSLDGGGEDGGGGGGGGGDGDGGGGGGVFFGNMTIPSSSSHQTCVPYFCRIRCLQCNIIII